MVEFITDSGEFQWVITDDFGVQVAERLRDADFIQLDDGVVVWLKMSSLGDDKDFSIQGRDIDAPGDEKWTAPFSMANPEMRTSLRPNINTSIGMQSANEISMATFADTINGAMANSEFYQERDEPAEALMRIPVPEEIRDDVVAEMTQPDNCELAREQVRGFRERFSQGGEPGPTGYRHPHIRCTGVETTEELLSHFERAMDMIERGVEIFS